MASFYVKLFGSILDSTIWNEPDNVRLVWITMLAMADQYGMVEAAMPGLAVRARVSEAACEAALLTLASPDKNSRTKTNEGRRIREVDGGWFILNYEAYRRRRSAEEQREKNAARMRRARSRTVHERAECDAIVEGEVKGSEKETDPPRERAPDLTREARYRTALPIAGTRTGQDAAGGPTPGHTRVKSSPPFPLAVSPAHALFQSKLKELSKLDDLDVVDLADQCVQRLIVGAKTAWVLQALVDANNKSEAAELRHVRHARVVSFIANAKRPKAEQRSNTPAHKDFTYEPGELERPRMVPRRPKPAEEAPPVAISLEAQREVAAKLRDMGKVGGGGA